MSDQILAITVYAHASRSYTLTINKANPAVTWPTGLTAITGQTLSQIALPGNGSSNPAGTFTWTTPGSSVGAAGTQSHSMTFTPNDTANYNTVMQNVTITVMLPTYTVTFVSNGGTAVSPRTGVVSGTTITAPAQPTRTGYLSKFAGWYKEAGLTNVWNFGTDQVTANITLYAKWENYIVGNTGPGGGIIFHVVPGGFTVEGYTGTTGTFASYTAYYLEAAPSNSSASAQWGADGTLIQNGLTTFTSTSDVLASRIGNGRKDTQIIVAHLGTSETGGAAQVAAAATFGGRSDWFLPSLGELNLLYEQRNLTGIGITSGVFWSSSQYNLYNAWSQVFLDGGRNRSLKSYDYSVRVVRAF